MTANRVRACPRAALSFEDVLPVPLPRGNDRRPREALVLLGDDDKPRAYLNRCRHLPIPLDAGSRSFLTADGKHLLCGTHGAVFRRNDGVCTTGPCLSLSLDVLEVEEEAGELYVVVPPPDED